MSIATDEARRHIGYDAALTWEDRDLTAAYVAGRTAEPTEAEVDAAAFAQFKAANNNSSWRLTEEQYRESWNSLPDMVSDDFRRKARIGLAAARKAVAGDE